jgi:hypothetical protein
VGITRQSRLYALPSLTKVCIQDNEIRSFATKHEGQSCIPKWSWKAMYCLLKALQCWSPDASVFEQPLKAHSPHCSLAAMHKHLENNSGVFEWIWLLFALNTGFKPVSAPPPGQVTFAGRRGRAVKLQSMKQTHALLT